MDENNMDMNQGTTELMRRLRPKPLTPTLSQLPHPLPLLGFVGKIWKFFFKAAHSNTKRPNM